MLTSCGPMSFSARRFAKDLHRVQGKAALSLRQQAAQGIRGVQEILITFPEGYISNISGTLRGKRHMQVFSFRAFKGQITPEMALELKIEMDPRWLQCRPLYAEGGARSKKLCLQSYDLELDAH